MKLTDEDRKALQGIADGTALSITVTMPHGHNGPTYVKGNPHPVVDKALARIDELEARVSSLCSTLAKAQDALEEGHAGEGAARLLIEIDEVLTKARDERELSNSPSLKVNPQVAARSGVVPMAGIVDD